MLLNSLNLTVCDFTSRLPGPLAGSILADLGAKVVKIELSSNLDPFNPQSKTSPEEVFAGWYKNLNSEKDSLIIDSLDSEDVRNILTKSDLALIPNNRNYSWLKEKYPETTFVEVCGGSGEQKYLHDLNALFLTNSFKLHLMATGGKTLPYLPIAGVVFAQQIALEALSAHIQSKQGMKSNKKVYLDKAAKQVLDKLWTTSLHSAVAPKALHTGKYPCYNIYQTSDGRYIGLAAVENKFWIKFCEVFNLSLSLDDRFDETGRTGQSISKMFLTYTGKEVEELIGNKDICINVFPEKEKE
ncbi:MAG: hypothetical protein CME64_17670 [Halobacteriovoraceae bacterium]|nr:hypothetical protein [Halobacteriovoraceae bacterium]|tara:strand:- start:46499 stop:47395 length:897 start_codon:yes stop_codon:yes gene_type:complete